MENITIYSVGWISASQTHAYRMALCGDQFWLETSRIHTRASKRTSTSTDIRKSDWMVCTTNFLFDDVIGLPQIDHIEIPKDRWSTITYQLNHKLYI